MTRITTAVRVRLTALREFVRVAAFLAEGPWALWRGRILAVSVAQMLGELGSAFGLLALIFFIRMTFTEGQLQYIPLSIDDPTSTTTILLAMVSILAIIGISAFLVYWGRKTVADIVVEYAGRVRRMVLDLIGTDLTSGWASVVDERQPSLALVRVLVSRYRSATMAQAEVLTLGAAAIVFAVSIVIMLVLDAVALAVVTPVAVGLLVISEYVNRDVHSITVTYDQRSVSTRERLAGQIDDVTEGLVQTSDISLVRVETDDAMFHDRILAVSRLRALATFNAAVLIAVLVVYFLISAGTDGSSLELIIVYLFAARYALRSVQTILRALVQVARRLEDYRSFRAFIDAIDDLRVGRVTDHSNVSESSIALAVPGAEPVELGGRQVTLVLMDRPATHSSVTAMLSALQLLLVDSDGVRLVDDVRIEVSTPEVPNPDILSTALVRVLITEDPVPVARVRRRALTFVVSHKPRLVFAKGVRDHISLFDFVFVMRNNQVAGVWPMEQAISHPEDVRRAHKPRAAVPAFSAHVSEDD